MARMVWFAVAMLLLGASAEYTDDDDVVVLTPENFDESVIASEELWFVEFYAPWCGHCKNIEPEWKKAATVLKGITNLGAVDADAHKDLGSKYGVTGFPTLKVFGHNKAKPTDLSGRTAKDIASAAVKEVKDLVRNRLGLKAKKAKAPPAPRVPSKVVTLTADNFEEQVAEGLWFVEFHAPWCGHCKKLAPHWEKAAAKLDGKMKLGAVDATVHTELASTYGVQGYPTIKVFPDRSMEPEDFKGGGTTETIVAEGLKLLGVEEEASEASDEPSAVVVLTDATFDDAIATDDLWLVEFFAPWCGHCKKLAPEFAKASLDLEGLVKLATVDTTTNQALGTKYEISSYPTLKYFSEGEMLDFDFPGGNTQSQLVSSAKAALEDHKTQPREVVEITSQSVYDEQCATLCLVVIVPHVLDTGVEGRNEYLDMIKTQAKKHKSRDVGFVWSSAMDQEKMEDALELSGKGYPAMALLNGKKGRYIPFASAFTADGVTDFVSKCLNSNMASVPLPKLPVGDVTPWDGKAAAAPVDDYEEEEEDETVEEDKEEL